MSQFEPIDQTLLNNPGAEAIVCSVLRQVFYQSYERAFGQPSCDIRAKVDRADAETLSEWLPNFVGAGKSTDIFVTGLERALAQFASSMMARNLAIESGPVHGLADVLDALRRHGLEGQPITADQPPPSLGA